MDDMLGDLQSEATWWRTALQFNTLEVRPECEQVDDLSRWHETLSEIKPGSHFYTTLTFNAPSCHRCPADLPNLQHRGFEGTLLRSPEPSVADRTLQPFDFMIPVCGRFLTRLSGLTSCPECVSLCMSRRVSVCLTTLRPQLAVSAVSV